MHMIAAHPVRLMETATPHFSFLGMYIVDKTCQGKQASATSMTIVAMALPVWIHIMVSNGTQVSVRLASTRCSQIFSHVTTVNVNENAQTTNTRIHIMTFSLLPERRIKVAANAVLASAIERYQKVSEPNTNVHPCAALLWMWKPQAGAAALLSVKIVPRLLK